MILDTNAYSALVVNAPQLVDLLAHDTRIALPLPVIAELRSGFLGGNRPVENADTLSNFLAQDSVDILVPSADTTHRYAQLQHYAKSRGRILSNNDIWIAALAQEDGDCLITYDRDFAIFQDIFDDKLLVLS